MSGFESPFAILETPGFAPSAGPAWARAPLIAARESRAPIQGCKRVVIAAAFRLSSASFSGPSTLPALNNANPT